MKRKQLLLAIALLLAAGGLWYGRTTGWIEGPVDSSDGSSPTNHDTASRDARVAATNGQPAGKKMLQPPDELRKFQELTPEQRVRRARNPNGVGG